MSRPSLTLDQAVERLYDLNVGVIGSGHDRHERPHKPALLLAVLDLIALGKASPSRIPWTQELRSRFTLYFEVVRRRNDQDKPENPFFYLRSDKIWEPLRVIQGEERPLESPPNAPGPNEQTTFARLINGMEDLVGTLANRAALREALVSRYFPSRREEVARLFAEHGVIPQPETGDENSSRVTEEPGEAAAGRNPAFRRKILEIYDHQCAMCGLRIRLPGTDLTFVDGAHLIPYSEGANDHPTNGIALCKNHHWAMDRFLIAPTLDPSDLRWKVSPMLDARRSEGEKMLLEFDNQKILLPHEEAFFPAQASLQWRFERLLKAAG